MTPKIFINKNNIRPIIILILSGVILTACSDTMNDQSNKQNNLPESFQYSIPAAGNSWVIDNNKIQEKIISDSGITNWSKTNKKVRTFFHISEVTDIDIAMRAKAGRGDSKVSASFNRRSKPIKVSNTEFDTLMIGTFTTKKPGYQYLEFEKPNGTSDNSLDITHILLNGIESKQNIHFVTKDFYWGRRGPSVHLNYQKPKSAGNAKWFYNEVTIPEGYDIIGSFYMANGFSNGYFGMQVNSPNERRILFSVWSPYETDNPGEIPEEYRIKLLNKGEKVYAGKFGNEGSGGQSYLKYNWQADKTYRFLLRGEPKNHSTIYTAYFRAPDMNEWKLISSFQRPKTSTYLHRLHSFLENFIPETGYKTRKGFYSNQWICDKEGYWHELTEAKFTADATARKGERLDYTGGTKEDRFYLKNCGFFDTNLSIGKILERAPTGNHPDINFSLLNQMIH